MENNQVDYECKSEKEELASKVRKSINELDDLCCMLEIISRQARHVDDDIRGSIDAAENLLIRVTEDMQDVDKRIYDL